jgi:hypothetical protein
MFIDEAKLTARLGAHPKIAQTYELGKADGELFIAMEFVEGIDILAMLREMAWMRRRVNIDHAAWICHEVLDALDFAHNLKDEQGNSLGIVHRDISPSNVLLSRRGDIKLVDFGIARASGPDRHHHTKAGTLKGKYGYMSPEQVIEHSVDARSDLFSVGVLLAEMLCGRRLFAAPAEIDVLLMVRDAKLSRLDQFGTHIPASLDNLLRRALRKDPSERWSSAAEMRDALAQWLFDERKRVGPKQIAELVDSLHDQVWRRRRESMVQSYTGAAGPSEAAADEPVAAHAPGAPAAPPPHDSNDLDLSIAEGSPVIASKRPTPGTAVPKQALTATFDPIHSSPSLDIDVSSLGDLVLPAALSAPLSVTSSDGSTNQGRRRVSTTPVPVRPAAPDSEIDFSDVSRDIEAVTPRRSTDELVTTQPADPAARIVSIADAIASLTLPDPDLSTLEFDDEELDGSGPRSQPVLMSTAAEYVDAAELPEPPELGEILSPPTSVGDFAQTPPIMLLFQLISARSTGLLTTAVGGIKKEVYLRSGNAEHVTSNMASELLGHYLVSNGALSSGELAMALAMMPHYGGKLGDTLVGLGLLKPLEVFRHLTFQIRQKLIDVCTWTKGSYAWHEGKGTQRASFPLDLNPFEVLGAGAMALHADAISQWFDLHGTRRLTRSRERSSEEVTRFEIPGLVALFARISSKTTIAKLVNESRDSHIQRRTMRMLFLLQQCEFFRTAAG